MKKRRKRRCWKGKRRRRNVQRRKKSWASLKRKKKKKENKMKKIQLMTKLESLPQRYASSFYSFLTLLFLSFSSSILLSWFSQIKKRKLSTGSIAILQKSVAEVIEYLAKKHQNEIFASGHKDDNYPSTLQGKVVVNHVANIPDLDEYTKDPTQYFYKKSVDLKTLELRDIEHYCPTAEEAIDYDPKRRRSSTSLHPPVTPKGARRSSTTQEKSPSTPLRGSITSSTSFSEERGLVIKKTRVERHVQARKALCSQGGVGIPAEFVKKSSYFGDRASAQMRELEHVLENQCNTLLDQLRKLDAKQEQNDKVCSEVLSKMTD
eukprot:TRINITY_DN5736_c0_g1_i1.p1 TRINITY_DN5736_c0_g1~~TRINITY_DN5736_c0_g1_i1.p1  ORF type:complete len:320 (+),score=82.32 TRINITY_DN5736_c0_g1_i1:290-1249(+)